MKPRIYLQSGFWEQLSKEKKTDELTAKLYLSAALKDAQLITDIDLREEQPLNENEEFLRSIQIDSVSVVDICTNQYIYKVLNGLENTSDVDDLCAVYLLDDQKMCDGYKIQYGVLCLTAQDVCKKISFFRGSAVLYEKRDSCDGFGKCSHPMSTPCNSLIIIDPYLFKTSYNVENIVKPLLDKLLPNPATNGQFKLPFHLSIFYDSQNTDAKLEQEVLVKDIETVIDILRDGKINVIVSLYQVATTGKIKDDKGNDIKDEMGNFITGDFHSRHIITNSMMVNAEDGFDIFVYDKKSRQLICGKWARFEFVWPSLDDNSRKDRNNYYRWLEICLDNINNPKKCRHFRDSHNDGEEWSGNRLFDLVKTKTE